MSTSASIADERATDVVVTEDELTVRLMDGRAISTPLVWYPRLLKATAEQRANWKISGGGYGIHWEDVDEDLSIEGMLRGVPAGQQLPRSSMSVRSYSQAAAGPFEAQPGSVDATPEVSDEEKGILDYYIEAEQAAVKLYPIIVGIGEQIAIISAKIDKRNASINDLTESPLGVGAQDLNTIFMLTAADINEFSKTIEQTVPDFVNHAGTLEKSLSVYISLAKPDDTGQEDQLKVLRETLDVGAKQVRASKEAVAMFRDAAQSVREGNLSTAINKAVTRLTQVLNTLIAAIEEYESFSLRTVFQIDEKLSRA